MVGVGEMVMAGTESRVSGTRRRALTLVPGTPEEASVPVADPALLRELKEQIRAVLMTRIDPSVAGLISRAAGTGFFKGAREPLNRAATCSIALPRSPSLPSGWPSVTTRCSEK